MSLPLCFFSFQLKEEKRKVKAFHLLHTWNELETNLAIWISEKSKKKKMWLNYKMPATELLMLNFSIANSSECHGNLASVEETLYFI